jgi:hypothetical protein
MSPSSGPWRKIRRLGLLPPRYQYGPSGNFFKKSFRINPVISLLPPGGTQPQNFISQIWPVGGPYCRRFKHFTGHPDKLPLVVPFAGPGGDVSGPQRRRFIFPGGGLGAQFGVLVPPGGEVGQERGRRQPEPISFRLQLPVSALFARVLLYGR